jgi:uncharacterized membrane protein YeiH
MTLLYALDLLGTAAFAASGALAGIRRNMDIFGVLVLGIVTATGGGTLRDLLLGDTLPFILKDETYLLSLEALAKRHEESGMPRPSGIGPAAAVSPQGSPASDRLP